MVKNLKISEIIWSNPIRNWALERGRFGHEIANY
jgi:hypothetical protein